MRNHKKYTALTIFGVASTFALSSCSLASGDDVSEQVSVENNISQEGTTYDGTDLIADTSAQGDLDITVIESNTEEEILKAHLSVSPVATEGIETNLSAVGTFSKYRELTYEFDIDGNGTFDLKNDHGVALVVFDKPGIHQATVQVTDAEGNVDTESIEFDVAPALEQ